MRFDDSLRTVLAADTATPFGAASTWRQLVDLAGRGRAGGSGEAIARLRAIRAKVPTGVRAASARALAFASPDAALVTLFAEEELEAAAPVLRTAVLPSAEWIALLPLLSPAKRAVLRHRRDLPGEVGRALDGFGRVDFVIEGAPADLAPPAAAPAAAVPSAAVVPPAASTASTATVVAAEADTPAPAAPPNGYPISDLVERIAAFQRDREASDTGASPAPAPMPADGFSFETDAAGAIRWVEGAPRAPLIGLTIAVAGTASGVDGAVAGAFRRRSAFGDGRLSLGGASSCAGAWRISGEPRFDPATGRCTGYVGTARRPRADENATPRAAAADALRQLVHELRTPANAIAGFAELIEHELLGDVPAPYRGHAVAIREQASDLVAAIGDLDTVARIEGCALELRPGQVALAPLLARTVQDLAGLALARGAGLVLVPVPAGLVAEVDERAAERLVARLLGVALSAAGAGERLAVAAMRDPGGHALLLVDRPAPLAAFGPAQLLDLGPEAGDGAGPGTPLLGTGFSLRLVQSLAAEVGGALGIEPRRLTLRLPAAVAPRMDLASTR